MNRIARFFSNFETRLSYFLIVLLTIILSIQIVNRYIFSTSFVWLEEIARISFVWLIYFCVASAARENDHIRVGLIDMFVSPATLRIINYIADALVVGFNLVIVWYGVQLMISSITYGDKTPVTNIPMTIIYAVIPFCFALMVFRILGYTIRDLQGKSPVDHDDGQGKLTTASE